MSTSTAQGVGPAGAAVIAFIAAGYVYTQTSMTPIVKLGVSVVLVLFGVASLLSAILSN
jgi:hypothetical protein